MGLNWKTTATGVLKVPNVPDRFGMIYTESSLDEIVQQLSERIKNGVAYGEFDPETSSATVSLENVSHRLTGVYINEDGVYADIEILDTPRGKELLAVLAENKDSVRMTSRIIGTSGANGVVDDGLSVISVDLTDE